MNVLAIYSDPFWDDVPIETIRYTVRIILENHEGQFGFLKIVGEDALGQRNHFETCGGGVEENETFFEAARREAEEEMGVVIKDLSEIGLIIDRLNPLQRLTCSIYVHAKVDCFIQQLNRTESEMILIESIVWLEASDVIMALSKAQNPIDAYVHRRDLRAFIAFLENQNLR
jgi:8-oxo-dGTP diphosphatase